MKQAFRYCGKADVKPNNHSSDSTVECREKIFYCLIVNLNKDECVLDKVPEIETISLKNYADRRNELLLLKLTLGYLFKGQKEIKEIYCEFNDIFKLPGDRLTEMRGVVY